MIHGDRGTTLICLRAAVRAGARDPVRVAASFATAHHNHQRTYEGVPMTPDDLVQSVRRHQPDLFD